MQKILWWKSLLLEKSWIHRKFDPLASKALQVYVYLVRFQTARSAFPRNLQRLQSLRCRYQWSLFSGLTLNWILKICTHLGFNVSACGFSPVIFIPVLLEAINMLEHTPYNDSAHFPVFVKYYSIIGRRLMRISGVRNHLYCANLIGFNYRQLSFQYRFSISTNINRNTIHDDKFWFHLSTYTKITTGTGEWLILQLKKLPRWLSRNMATDVLAPCDASSLAKVLLNIQDKPTIVL